MTPEVLAGASLVVATTVIATLLVQPRLAWRDAAEHSRLFWVVWALAGVSLGVGGLLLLGVRWRGAGWLAFWVAVGSLQPSMVTDVLDVRQLRRWRRHQADSPTTPEAALRPIRWEAPSVAELASGGRTPAASPRRVA
jgi:hypothetical protein